MKFTSTMPLRTRIFSVLIKRISTPVEELGAAGLPGARESRLRLQGSRIGRRVFGTAVAGVRIEDRVVDLGGTDIRMRIYRPAADLDRLPVLLNFHGGGWVQGNPEQSEWAASRIAREVGAVVISVAYRFAPEHPYPAAVGDCWAALNWVHDNAGDLRVDAGRIAVMGDSAGGNLAAVVALMARDAGGPALRAQVLVYPGVEMYDKWPSEIRHADAPVLTSKNMRAFVKIYLGDSYGTEDFAASPIRAASHAGLPPTLIQTAEFDPLLDNGARYADALRAGGVEVTYTAYAGAIHGFLSLPGIGPFAKDALAEIVPMLKGAFASL